MDYLLYGLTVFALITLLYRMSLWIARKRKPSDVLLAVTVVGFLIFVGVEFLQETALIASSEIHFLIADWSYTIAIVALLIGLGLAIRESKPVINQSPQVLSYLPVLLLVVHPLVQDTLVIRELLLDLYTISAFLIAFGLFSVEYFRRNTYGVLLSGVLVLFAGYIIRRHEIIPILHQEIGQLIVISGILIQSKHYNIQLLKSQKEHYDTQNRG